MPSSWSLIVMRGKIRSLLLLLLVASFGLLPVSLLAEEPAGDEHVDEHVDEHASAATIDQPREVDTGYVFIDGRYLPGPYLVEQTKEGVLINGELIKSEQFPRFNSSRPGFGGSGRPGWQGGGGPWSGPLERRSGQEGPWQGESDANENPARIVTVQFRRPATFAHLQWRVVYRLEQEAALVAFADRPLVVLEAGPAVDDLLAAFAASDTPAIETVLAVVPEEDHELWKSWLTSYEAPPELASLSAEKTAAKEALLASNQAEVAAVRRIDRFSYPLSLVGMVLGVLATGHLLKSVPPHDPKTADDAMRLHFMRFAVISAGLVFVFSSLDLVWTLLAAQAGQMRELNPLGQGLIKNPASLAAFKLSATLVSCSLLVALRRHHTAQLASWWLCLICTMLTFRWLMFNSMFMGS